jgi:DNA repair exonuclease SbcCD ATPase subunit
MVFVELAIGIGFLLVLGYAVGSTVEGSSRKSSNADRTRRDRRTSSTTSSSSSSANSSHSGDSQRGSEEASGWNLSTPDISAPDISTPDLDHDLSLEKGREKLEGFFQDIRSNTEEAEEEISEEEKAINQIKQEIQDIDTSKSFKQVISDLRRDNDLPPSVRNDLVKLKAEAREEEEFESELERILKEEKVTLNHLQDLIKEELDAEQKLEEIYEEFERSEKMLERLLSEEEKWSEEKERLIKHVENNQGANKEALKQLEQLMYNFYDLNQELRKIKGEPENLRKQIENIRSNLGIEDEVKEVEVELSDEEETLEKMAEREERFEKYWKEGSSSRSSDFAKGERIAQELAERARDEITTEKEEERIESMLNSTEERVREAGKKLFSASNTFFSTLNVFDDEVSKAIVRTKKSNVSIGQMLNREGYEFNRSKWLFRHKDR